MSRPRRKSAACPGSTGVHPPAPSSSGQHLEARVRRRRCVLERVTNKSAARGAAMLGARSARCAADAAAISGASSALTTTASLCGSALQSAGATSNAEAAAVAPRHPHHVGQNTSTLIRRRRRLGARHQPAEPDREDPRSSKIYNHAALEGVRAATLTAESLVDKAMEIEEVAGTYGGIREPAPSSSSSSRCCRCSREGDRRRVYQERGLQVRARARRLLGTGGPPRCTSTSSRCTTTTARCVAASPTAAGRSSGWTNSWRSVPRGLPVRHRAAPPAEAREARAAGAARRRAPLGPRGRIGRGGGGAGRRGRRRRRRIAAAAAAQGAAGAAAAAATPPRPRPAGGRRGRRRPPR